ncbi:MAG: GH3 auxin-responsive promoter family protein [Thermodesulfobacteriota bacterium]
MELFTTSAHRAAMVVSRKGYRAYLAGLADIRPHQQRNLGSILKTVRGAMSGRNYGLTGDESVDRFRAKVPLTEYSHWEKMIEQQRRTGEPILSTSACDRYQPTSGSTSKIKWIPYTRQFLAQVDAFISPMIYRMYRQYPGIRKGVHYWSLSWIPTELRGNISPNINDDLKLLPWWKRMFMSQTMAVPDDVAHAPTSDASMFATACYLCAARDLSLVSVWSPTFLLNLLDLIHSHREEIALVLASGKWGESRQSLAYLPCPRSRQGADTLAGWETTLSPENLSRLWPGLSVISAWDTWTSATWAREIKRLFPFAALDGKGLLATEGIVSMPFDNRYPLTYQCHFYEFADWHSSDILSAWELKKGQVVQPVLTTGSGLLRYLLHDKLEVTGFLGSCPCFLFLGRSDGVDLVGEKLSPEAAQHLLGLLAENHGIKPVSLLAVPRVYSGTTDGYVLLCEGSDPALAGKIAERAEKELRKIYHYNLARDLRQLTSVKCVMSPTATAIYQSRAASRGMVAGNLKIEPVVLWNCELPEPLRSAFAEAPSTADRSGIYERP